MSGGQPGGGRPTTARHTLDGIFWGILGEGLAVPAGFLIFLFLASRLGPAGYGTYSMAASLVIWIEGGLVSLFDRATIKLTSEAPDWKPVGSAIFRLQLGISLSAAFLLVLLAGPLSVLLLEPELAVFLRLFALDIPLACLAHFHKHILVGVGSFRKKALVGTTRQVFRLFLTLILVQLGLSISGAILGVIGASLLELWVARVFVRPSPFTPHDVRPRLLWAYAAPLFVLSMSLRLFDKLGLLALKALGGTAGDVGVYSSAQNLAMLPGLVTITAAPLLLSTLSRAIRDGDEEQARQFGRHALRLGYWLLPFAALTAGAAPDIVRLLLDATFAPTARLLPLLIFVAVALSSIALNTSILVALGKPRWTVVATLPMLPAALIGHLFLIPTLGGRGAALVTLAVAAAGVLSTTLAVRRAWGILPPFGTIWRSTLAATAIYPLALLPTASSPLVVLKLLFVGLAAAGLLFLLGEFPSTETALLRSLFFRRPQPGG